MLNHEELEKASNDIRSAAALMEIILYFEDKKLALALKKEVVARYCLDGVRSERGAQKETHEDDSKVNDCISKAAEVMFHDVLTDIMAVMGVVKSSMVFFDTFPSDQIKREFAQARAEAKRTGSEKKRIRSKSDGNVVKFPTPGSASPPKGDDHN